MLEVPGTLLVEPYKHTQLALSGPVVAGDEGYTYVWEITGEKGRVTGEGNVPDKYEGDLLSRGTQQDVFLKQVGRCHKQMPTNTVPPFLSYVTHPLDIPC